MESVGNRLDESISERETRVHEEGLRRMQGDAPIIGGKPTQQHEVITERRAGLHAMSHSPYEEIPFSEQVAGVSGKAVSTTAPNEFNHPVHPVPEGLRSNSGAHMNTAEILSQGIKR